MEVVLDFIKDLPNHIIWLEAFLVALIAVFVMIPGEQPEKFLQSVVEFIKKFSRKK